MQNRVAGAGLWRVFGPPMMIGLLSLFGLMAALLSAGFGRYFAWIAVGSPLIAIFWFCFRQFRNTWLNSKIALMAAIIAILFLAIYFTAIPGQAFSVRRRRPLRCRASAASQDVWLPFTDWRRDPP